MLPLGASASAEKISHRYARSESANNGVWHST